MYCVLRAKKLASAWKNYTTAGCGGCDKYQQLQLVIEPVYRGSSSILLLPFFWDTLYCPKTSQQLFARQKNYMKYIIYIKF